MSNQQMVKDLQELLMEFKYASQYQRLSMADRVATSALSGLITLSVKIDLLEERLSKLEAEHA